MLRRLSKKVSKAFERKESTISDGFPPRTVTEQDDQEVPLGPRYYEPERHTDHSNYGQPLTPPEQVYPVDVRPQQRLRRERYYAKERQPDYSKYDRPLTTAEQSYQIDTRPQQRHLGRRATKERRAQYPSYAPFLYTVPEEPQARCTESDRSWNGKLPANRSNAIGDEHL